MTSLLKNLKPWQQVTLLIFVIGIVLLLPFALDGFHFDFKTEQERYLEAHPEAELYDNTEVKEDSIAVLRNGKIAKSVFESEYSADTWFEEYSRNKVAFDNDYDEKRIDVYGEIKEISNNLGCAKVELKIKENPFCSISCDNCVVLKDKWAKEVMKLAVGNMVHIRGEYSGFVSSSAEMNLLRCHVIEDTPPIVIE